MEGSLENRIDYLINDATRRKEQETDAHTRWAAFYYDAFGAPVYQPGPPVTYSYDPVRR